MILALQAHSSQTTALLVIDDAGAEVATFAVVQEERVEVAEQAHRGVRLTASAHRAKSATDFAATAAAFVIASP